MKNAGRVELVEGEGLTESDVIDFCLDRIATFKIPRYVRFVTAWPMSSTKIRKSELRDQLKKELDAASIVEAPRIISRASRRRATLSDSAGK